MIDRGVRPAARTVADHGSAPEVKAQPAAQTMPAPPEAYEPLNG